MMKWDVYIVGRLLTIQRIYVKSPFTKPGKKLTIGLRKNDCLKNIKIISWHIKFEFNKRPKQKIISIFIVFQKSYIE